LQNILGGAPFGAGDEIPYRAQRGHCAAAHFEVYFNNAIFDRISQYQRVLSRPVTGLLLRNKPSPVGRGLATLGGVNSKRF